MFPFVRTTRCVSLPRNSMRTRFFSRIHWRGLRGKSAFTLTEVLLYAGLMGVIMGSVVLLTYATVQARARAQAGLIVNQNLRFALARMTARMHAADQISIPASGSSSTLNLVLTDASKNPTIFSLSGGNVLMREGSQSDLRLTSDELEIAQLTFTRISGPPDGIRIQMSGKLRTGSYAPVSLSASAILRR